MRSLSPIAALAFLLPASLGAQATPTKDQLAGTWVTVIHSDMTGSRNPQDRGWANNDPRVEPEYYLTLHANGTYMAQAKAKASGGVGIVGVGGMEDSSSASDAAGESPRVWGQWTLVGDSLKFGSHGRYQKFQVVLQGPELTLQRARVSEKAGPSAKEHEVCTQVFTRVDPAQSLPAPRPWQTCQTVAGPLPKPAPKAADLIGTWASMNAFVLEGRSSPLCAGFLWCEMIDTLTVQADSTLVHNVIRTVAYANQGSKSTTDSTFVKTAVKLRWWIASDTLWTAPATEPEKKRAAVVVLEDNGRYLIADGLLSPTSLMYQRVKP